jgi:hypothetical protein
MICVKHIVNALKLRHAEDIERAHVSKKVAKLLMEENVHFAGKKET